jgi:hypothetical protein
MGVYGFFFINFMVSFISDIVLNDLSTERGQKLFNSEIIKSLRPYFNKNFILQSGIYAGLTVVITLGILSAITYNFFNILYPTNNKELAIYCSISFALGYLVDYIIFKTKLLGKELDPYYKKARAGFWGAIAFVFSIIISYLLETNLLSIL